MSTEHAPAPEQAPPQATKVEPPCGVAVRFTIVPVVKVALQVVEQAVIPGGSLSTMPSPAPDLVTVSVKAAGAAVKVAVTVGLPTMTTVHDEPVPLQPAPLNPAKVEPLTVVALSVTVVPVAKSAAHVPGPVPARITVSRSVATATLKRAVTVAVVVTEQGPVPEHPSLQPANTEPGAAAAFNETVVPSSNCPEHVPPQSMPTGEDVTVPSPLPSGCFCTVTVKSRTRVISRSMGAPAVKFTPANVPPKIFAFAALKARTVIVRLGPTGAWMLTGISWPLVGSETGTVVVAGEGMPGPVIWTWIDAISETDCAHAGVAPGNQRSSQANTREAGPCCAWRELTINDKLTATV